MTNRFWYLTVLTAALLLPAVAQAGDHETCGIDNYLADFVLNDDSTLNVTEKISISCAIYDELHGIFKVVPTIQPRPEGNKESVQTPTVLESITDENGTDYNYTVEHNAKDTTTWKIGDRNVLIDKPTTYIIKYRVKNVVLTANVSSAGTVMPTDQFNWDVLGDAWEWPIKEFKATVTLPPSLNQSNVKTNLTAGPFGSLTDSGLASLIWTSDHSLEIKSTQVIAPKNPITLRLKFPVGIISHYQPTFSEKFGLLIWLALAFLLPLAVFIKCFRYWLRFGKDIRVKGSIAPEFGSPDDLKPLELSVLGLSKPVGPEIAATLINLAVRGYIVLSEKESKGLFGKHQYEFVKKNPTHTNQPLAEFERQFLDELTTGRALDQKMDLNDALKKIGLKWSSIKQVVTDDLTKRGIFDSAGQKPANTMFIGGFLALFGGFFLTSLFTAFGVSVIISGVIAIFFGLLMSKRTAKGAELFHRTQGFVLYLHTAERYRQVFNEKENIFERFLPYAILLGIAKQWARAMEKLSGEQFKNYHPVWFIGTGNFDSSNFASTVASIASVADAVSSSASSSAGGGSGGGGGGGGGGGW